MNLIKNIFILGLHLLLITGTLFADEKTSTEAEHNEEKTYTIKPVIVKGYSEKDPSKNIISVKNKKTVVPAQNVMDLLKDQAILDYSGKSNLVPDDDTFLMRGFSSKRFTTAFDGMTYRKTGGRKSSHIVDYGLVPAWLVDRVEIIPGPHSALYPGKSIGGTVNFVSARPKGYDSCIPSVGASGSYGSYNTQNYNLNLQGGIRRFNYDLGYQNYRTDGFLRNSAANINTLYARLGYLFSNNGYITLSSCLSKADREIPVNNNPASADPKASYDDSYPVITGSEFNDWQKPTWDKKSDSYRLDGESSSPIGLLKVNWYFSRETRDRAYDEYINKKNPSEGTRDGSWDTNWMQTGGRVEDRIEFSRNHHTTIAFDTEHLFDGYGDSPTWTDVRDYKHRVGLHAGALQHEARFFDSLILRAGLRYENVQINISNTTSSGLYITGEGDWIKRSFNGILPTSFLTYEMDKLHPFMRDTSLSTGISRIWHAPDYHGIYNPQGKPTGKWLDPEHGIAYDVVFRRRIINDITFKAQYSFYTIEDYMCYNSKYAKYTPSASNPVTPGMEYKDYMINLDKVHRHGAELSISGNIIDALHIGLSYAWQKFENRGDELAGEDGLSDRPSHRFNGSLRYTVPVIKTCLLFDYSYESEKLERYSDEIAAGEYKLIEKRVDDYSIMDIAIEQPLMTKKYGFEEITVKFFINNLADTEYEDARGYPMTERTFGAGLNIKYM